MTAYSAAVSRGTDNLRGAIASSHRSESSDQRSANRGMRSRMRRERRQLPAPARKYARVKSVRQDGDDDTRIRVAAVFTTGRQAARVE